MAKRGEEIVTITDLQKSQYGPKSYLNQGFWLAALGDERYPGPARAHVSTRLEILASASECFWEVRARSPWRLTQQSPVPDRSRCSRRQDPFDGPGEALGQDGPQSTLLHMRRRRR